MNCEHGAHFGPASPQFGGGCILCWKARAEKAEATLKNALEVSAKYEDRWHAEKQLREKAEAELETRKRCHKENEAAYAQMKERAERAEAACAEMRDALIQWQRYFESDDDLIESLKKTEHALSTDAGKGWLSPEEHKQKCAEFVGVARLEAAVDILTRIASHKIDTTDCADVTGSEEPIECVAEWISERLIDFQNDADSAKKKLAIAVEALEKIDCDCEEMWAGGKKPEASHHHSQCNYRIAREYLSKLKEDKA